jgi:hypothetical protein
MPVPGSLRLRPNAVRSCAASDHVTPQRRHTRPAEERLKNFRSIRCGLQIVISLGVSVLLIVATIFGWVQIAEAVIVHEGSTLVVVANSLRLLAIRD